MKKVLTFVSLLTALHASAGQVDSFLRFTQATGLLAPLSQAWNLLNDYEEIRLEAGVQTYHSDFNDYYAGALGHWVRDAWVDPLDNRTTRYRTQATTGGITTYDYNPFQFTMEKRTYVCVRYQAGRVVSYQTVSSDTTLWASHTVTRYPTQQINTGPASISCTFSWFFNQLGTGCDMYPPGNLWTLSSATVTRNQTRRDVPLPMNNMEVTGLLYGWWH